MKELRYQLKYALPVWFTMLITSFLPENRYTQRLRGRLIAGIVGSGTRLAVASDVKLVNVENLVLGNDVYIGPGVWMNAIGGVVLEDEVMLGPYTCIATAKHGFIKGSARFGGGHIAPVAIGRGSWLGSHVTVAPGVTLGPGNVVAANSVVNRDTPADVLIAGVPAVIKGPRVDDPGTIRRRADV